MVIREADLRIARASYRVAVGMIATRDPDAAALAQAALDHPLPITVRALLSAGDGKPWQPSLIDALAQIGIAAINEIMGDDDAE